MKLFIFLLLLWATPVVAQTTYYHVTAEQSYSPICAYTNPSSQWSECESGVTRSSNQAKNGSFSIRAADTTDGTLPGLCGEGNCRAHATHFLNPSGGLVSGATNLPQDLYFSTWFFFPSSATEGQGWSNSGNWQIWKNFFEFKNDNHSSYQDDSPQIEGRCCKILLAWQYINTPTAKRRWIIALRDAKWTNSPTTAAQNFAFDYFDNAVTGMHNLDTACCGENRSSDWYSDAFEIPLDTWIFLEMRVKFASQNGILEVWTGTASTGLIKIFQFSDPLLNTLKAIDVLGTNNWSTNEYLFWSVNNYLSDQHPAGTYVLYHDDSRITNFRVGPTLPEFSTPTTGVYYVKKTGSDSNNCTQAQNESTPKLTINSALACMDPAIAGSGGGRTIRIYAGVYAEAINNIIPGGTSWSNYFTIEKNPGDVVEIKPTSCSALIVIDVRRTNSKYFQIKGTSPTDRLKITAGQGTCNNDAIKFATSTSLGTPTFGRLMYLEVSNAINHGIQFTANSTNNEIKYNWIHHNGDQINVDDTHGSYIHSANNLIEGNIYEYNCNRGLQIYNSGSNNAHNNIVRGNIFRFNGTCEPAAGAVVSSGNNQQVYGNYFYDNTSHGLSISQNSPVNTAIYNNTFYNNDGSAINILAGASGTVIRNNIMRNNNATVTDAGTGTIQSNTLTSDPLFVNATARDLCILAGSPAINAGVAAIRTGVTRVYNGSAPDIGACETFGHSSAVVH